MAEVTKLDQLLLCSGCSFIFTIQIKVSFIFSCYTQEEKQMCFPKCCFSCLKTEKENLKTVTPAAKVCKPGFCICFFQWKKLVWSLHTLPRAVCHGWSSCGNSFHHPEISSFTIRGKITCHCFFVSWQSEHQEVNSFPSNCFHRIYWKKIAKLYLQANKTKSLKKTD